MAPKIKVTTEEILIAAVKIVQDKGINGVNARELAKYIGCSIQPVFRQFQCMTNLKNDLYNKVESIFNEQMILGMQSGKSPFLGMGLAYIKFAKNEKNLFKFLFMSDEIKGRNVFDMMKDEENQEIIKMISAMTKLNLVSSEKLFISIWFMTHGIASMITNSDFKISEEQISDLLADSFSGMKYQLKLKEGNI